MATISTYDQNTTMERPANKNLYWVIAAAVVLLIALGYAITPNRSFTDTPMTPAVETTAPITTVPAVAPPMDPGLTPLMNGGANMETTTVPGVNMDSRTTPGAAPLMTDPMVNDPAVSDPAVSNPAAPATTRPMTTDGQ